MVTPFELRAETSNPNGKCRSIFFTGGFTRYIFRISWSSIVDGEVLSFLEWSQWMTARKTNITNPDVMAYMEGRTIPSFAFRWEAPAQSSEFLVGHTCLASVPWTESVHSTQVFDIPDTFCHWWLASVGGFDIWDSGLFVCRRGRQACNGRIDLS